MILGIETSCDDTSVALLDAYTVRSLVTESQLADHARYGGIVPEIASRQHIATIAAVHAAALDEAGAGAEEIRCVAVTRGPGLSGALVVGLNFAKGLAMGLGIPLVGVNHLEAHAYATWIGRDPSEHPEFPAVCLIVSGGHSEITLMRDHGDHRLIGRTRDDAAGEAFDKVARVLGLEFPGGPAIERLIDGGSDSHLTPFHLPRAMLEGTYDFSFSGLKTAIYRAKAGKLGPAETRRIFKEGGQTEFERGDASAHARMAAGFQSAVVDVLVAKTAAAAEEFEAKSVIVAGGVAANRLLRQKIRAAVGVPLHLPEIRLCTDNGAMVAMAGAFLLKRGRIASPDLDVDPNLRLASEPVATER